MTSIVRVFANIMEKHSFFSEIRPLLTYCFVKVTYCFVKVTNCNSGIILAKKLPTAEKSVRWLTLIQL